MSINNLTDFLLIPENQREQALTDYLTQMVHNIKQDWQHGDRYGLTHLANQTSKRQLTIMQNVLLDYLNTNLAFYLKANMKTYRHIFQPLLQSLLDSALPNQRLATLDTSQRYTFTGTFLRLGLKKYQNYHINQNVQYLPTILLGNIQLNNQVIANKLWFQYGKRFQHLGQLKANDLIQFNGRIKSYQTMGKHPKIHYKIINPTQIQLLHDAGQRSPIPSDNPAIIGMILNDNQKRFQIMPKNSNYYLTAYQQWKQSMPCICIKK